MATNFPFQLPEFNKPGLILFFAFYILVDSQNFAQQTSDPFGILKIKASHPIVKEDLLKSDLSKSTDESKIHYKLPLKQLNKWMDQYHPIISTNLELPEGKKEECYLTPFDFFEPNFKTYLIHKDTQEEISLERGRHYKGILRGENNAYFDLSLFTNEMRGLLVKGNKNTISLKSTEIQNNQLLCTARKDETAEENDELFECHTDDVMHYLETGREMNSRLRDNCNRVSISVRADYELYRRFGNNPQAVTNYITGLFNNLNTIYRREDIQISLAEIFIHVSPDGFPNTTSTLALDFFRRNYQNYSGDIHLCLSGVLKNGRASLGGIAYINALCVKAYSYAYVNVNTQFLQFPQYSFDIYATAHELGHILGSRHTHACVWGPNKNQALDNCARVEGSCLPGPKPSKGTMMSYCHISGQPGVDLSLGFGAEPGELIRSKVKNSSCLNSYTPETKTYLTPDLHLSANVECSDGVYSHYYYDNNTIDPADDILLLSINKKGQNIGYLADGSLQIVAHTTDLAGSGKGIPIQTSFTSKDHEYLASNKYWEIIPSKQPEIPVSVKAYFHPGDLNDLFASSKETDYSNLVIYTIQSPGDPDPQSNHRYATASDYQEYTTQSKNPSQSYSLLEEKDLYTVEINTSRLNSLNAARKLAKDAKEETKNQSEFASVRARGFSNYQNITWSTSKEVNSSYFIIEKSLNSIKFDSIGRTTASGTSQTLINYTFNDFKVNKDVWYRITLVDAKGARYTSAVVSLTSSYNASNQINLFPNPVSYTDLTLEYNQTSTLPQQTQITVLDPLMASVRSVSAVTNEGKNQIMIPFSDLTAPFYYIRLSSAGQTSTQKIVVKR